MLPSAVQALLLRCGAARVVGTPQWSRNTQLVPQAEWSQWSATASPKVLAAPLPLLFWPFSSRGLTDEQKEYKHQQENRKKHIYFANRHKEKAPEGPLYDWSQHDKDDSWPDPDKGKFETEMPTMNVTQEEARRAWQRRQRAMQEYESRTKHYTTDIIRRDAEADRPLHERVEEWVDKTQTQVAQSFTVQKVSRQCASMCLPTDGLKRLSESQQECASRCGALWQATFAYFQEKSGGLLPAWDVEATKEMATKFAHNALDIHDPTPNKPDIAYIRPPYTRPAGEDITPRARPQTIGQLAQEQQRRDEYIRNARDNWRTHLPGREMPTRPADNRPR